MITQTDFNLLATWLRDEKAATALIDKYHSLAQITTLSVDELRKCADISSQNAFNLKLLPELTRLYLSENNKLPDKYDKDEKSLGKYFIHLFTGAKNEAVAVLSYTKSQQPKLSFIGGGIADAVNITAGKIIDIAVENKASSIIIAHCHPRGSADPSPGDIAATRRLIDVLESEQIILREHFVVGVNDYYPIIKNLYK